VLSPRLFAMGQAVQHGTRLQPTFSGTLDDPAWHMIDDHDEIGTLLRSIRSLTHNYKLSQDACKHYQALYQGLTNFEEDFLCQVHLKKQHPLSASF